MAHFNMWRHLVFHLKLRIGRFYGNMNNLQYNGNRLHDRHIRDPIGQQSFCNVGESCQRKTPGLNDYKWNKRYNRKSK